MWVSVKNRKLQKTTSSTSLSLWVSKKKMWWIFTKGIRRCSPPDADKLRRSHWLLTNIGGSSVCIGSGGFAYNHFRQGFQSASKPYRSYFLPSIRLRQESHSSLVCICLISGKYGRKVERLHRRCFVRLPDTTCAVSWIIDVLPCEHSSSALPSWPRFAQVSLHNNHDQRVEWSLQKSQRCLKALNLELRKRIKKIINK